MSRLDSFIRRLEAQRACLDHAVDLIGAQRGPVLEIGLGNGRTYDHLRDRLPGRDIHAFDRQCNAHPACVPPTGCLWLGEFADSFKAAAAKLGSTAILAHCDTGSGDEAANARQALWLGPAVLPMLAKGAIVLSDQALSVDALAQLPLPPGVPSGRYFFYRYGG